MPIAIILTITALLALTACEDEVTAEDHFAQARTYLLEADYPAATIALKNVLVLDNGNLEARWLLAQTYLQTGDMLSAEKELRRLEELGFSPGELRPNLAKALLVQGKISEALSISSEDLEPTAEGSLLATQAMAALADQQTERALQLIELAVAADPDLPDVKMARATIAVRMNEDSATDLIQALREADDEQDSAHWLQAQALIREGKLDEARSILDGYILQSEDAAIADRVMRALVSLGMKDYDAAYRDANEVLRLAPENATANYIVGVERFQGQYYREAITALTFAEPIAQEFPLVLFYLGSSYLHERDLSLAETFARQFLKLAPNNTNGHKLLAAVMLLQGREGEAEAFLQPVLAQTPEDVQALNLMANVLLLTDRSDLGMLLYTRVAQLDPDWQIMPLPRATNGGTALQGEEDNFPQNDILHILNLLNQRDFDGAIEAAESYRFRDVHSVAPYNVEGRVLFSAGHQEQARQVFEKVLRREPANPSANWALAELALLEGQPDRAREYYKNVLRTNPNDLTTLLKQASLEQQLGRDGAMVERLYEAVRAHPRAYQPRITLAQYYLDSGNPDAVRAVFTGMESYQMSSPRVLEMIARGQIAAGDLGPGRETLETLVAENPRDTVGHYLIAELASASGDTARSRRALLAIIQIDPSHRAALTELAYMARAAGERNQFNAYVNTLQELEAEAPAVLRLRALGHLDRNEYAPALELSERALNLYPTTRTVLELAATQKFTDRMSAALETLERWVTQHPDDADARVFLANYLLEANRPEAAEVQYLAVLKRQPQHRAALNNLAWVLRSTDPERALRYIQAAAEQAPDQVEVIDTLAVVESLNGQHESAKRNIARALSAYPEDPSIRYHAAMISHAAGDTEDALATLSTLFEAEADDFPERDDALALLQSLQQE
ncbi:MAG: XrtA/PEP-CTERM system TPR-repeat protein PrsT [Pseudomonadota bacterium]